MKNTSTITRAAMLLALAIVFQNLRLIPGFAQNPASIFVIGSLVNLVLILSCELTGITSAVLIGILTAVISLMQGHIPFPHLMPVVAIGNIVLVTAYYFVKGFNKYAAIITGALLKWGFLFYSVMYVMNTFIKPAEPQKYKKVIQLLAFSFNYPQFITAIIGGLLAITIAQMLSKAGANKLA